MKNTLLTGIENNDPAAKTGSYGVHDLRLSSSSLDNRIEGNTIFSPSPWRPIETAPKDGTLILLYFSDPDAIAWGEHIWIARGAAKGDDFYWIDQSCDVLVLSDYRNQPTHWMHLPLPPA